MASGGVQMALKAVSEKGAISVLIFNRILMNFQTPRGGAEGFKWHVKSIHKRFLYRFMLAWPQEASGVDVWTMFGPCLDNLLGCSRALVFAKRFCLECTTAAVVHSKQNDQEAGRAWNA